MTEEERATRMQEASDLAGMMQHPGWKVIEDESKKRIASLTRKLVWADEPKNVLELQANIRSLEFLLTFPLQMMEAAQKATEQNTAQNAPA